jgi:hypothetical protein
MKAAEQRPIVAHGFNRGFKFTRPSKPRQGRQSRSAVPRGTFAFD